MERQLVENYKGKKGLISRTLERCRRSIGHRRSCPTAVPASKSRRLSRSGTVVKQRVAPGGYFTVYVGPEKERFVIKVECMSHPIFKDLLDEAEMEYGFRSEGPLELPCDVDLFYQVLCEIDQEMMASPKCGFARSSSGYRLLSPSRLLVMGQF